MAPQRQVNQYVDIVPLHEHAKYAIRIQKYPRDWKAIRELLRISPTHTLIIADYFRASKYFDDIVYDYVENNIHGDLKKTSHRYYKIIKAKHEEMDDHLCWITIMLFYNVFEAAFAITAGYKDMQETLRIMEREHDWKYILPNDNYKFEPDGVDDDHDDDDDDDYDDDDDNDNDDDDDDDYNGDDNSAQPMNIGR